MHDILITDLYNTVKYSKASLVKELIGRTINGGIYM